MVGREVASSSRAAMPSLVRKTSRESLEDRSVRNRCQGGSSRSSRVALGTVCSSKRMMRAWLHGIRLLGTLRRAPDGLPKRLALRSPT